MGLILHQLDNLITFNFKNEEFFENFSLCSLELKEFITNTWQVWASSHTVRYKPTSPMMYELDFGLARTLLLGPGA